MANGKVSDREAGVIGSGVGKIDSESAESSEGKDIRDIHFFAWGDEPRMVQQAMDGADHCVVDEYSSTFATRFEVMSIRGVQFESA